MLNYRDETGTEVLEEDYPKVRKELNKYLEKKDEGAIIDYIIDFCEYYNYRIEEIAIMLKADKMFSNLLKQDCLFRGILANPRKIKEW